MSAGLLPCHAEESPTFSVDEPRLHNACLVVRYLQEDCGQGGAMAVDLSSVVVKLGIPQLGASDYASVVSINIFVALICACIVIGHLLEENRWMNESITSLIIGLCTGAVIRLLSQSKNSHVMVFSEDLFFIYVLPPIIFNAGFQVKKKQFFRNFITIMLFGAVGTLISFFIISLGVIEFFRKMNIGALDIGDYLAIGAIFSATDSVCTLQVLSQDETPLLYSLVFGEGVVNDATSVVLFNAIQKFDLVNIDLTVVLQFVANFFYLFLTSTLLGAVAGLLSAYIIKQLYFGRHSTDREVALMILMAYLSYMLAELLDLSGILSVFFCGIIMSHYTWHNVTESSRVTTKHAFVTLSFIAEIFLFLYVGTDALDIEKWKFVSDRNLGAQEVERKTQLARRTTHGAEKDEYTWTKKEQANFVTNGKAEFHLLNVLPPQEVSRIGNYDSDKDLWKKFLELHEDTLESKLAKRDILRSQLTNLQMNKGEKVAQLHVRIKDLITQLNNLGEKEIEKSNNITLKAKKDESYVDSSFDDNETIYMAKKRIARKVRCYNCNEKRHIKDDCPKLKKKNKKGPTTTKHKILKVMWDESSSESDLDEYAGLALMVSHQEESID
ncbi:sodium/hydrogen exchanger 3-like [Zingiber officinale]|uniref:sodium/hydrogen exchanger 3-like n=1 Tax=Zingiber officinale TaxID=94328 RepID=UPI001C4B17E1|nr:sodium/hydrogen exchanger 3-like [Zingiber officinale]